MEHHSKTGKSPALLALATAAVLCGAAAAGPAAAKERGPDFDGADRQHGYRNYGDGSDLHRLGREEFDRGYRAGRHDERLRSVGRGGGSGEEDRSGARERFAGPGWNDTWQSESRERLERAAARLREALVLMRRQPSGRRLDEALEQARQALIRVQNAMTWLPRASDTEDDEDQSRYEQRSGQGIGAYRAFGGWRS